MITSYDEMIQEIETNIPDNTEQLITAEKVRTTLIDMVGVVSDVEEELDANIDDKADKDTTPFILEVEDITQLTNEQVESLKAGDIVSADLAYLVSFKSEANCFLTSYDGADLFICTYYKENDIWVCDGISSHNLDTFANKVHLATNGDFAGLDSNGNLTDSGSKASDFATAAQGALADTAYQKPSTGIPASDLESGVIPAPEVFAAPLSVMRYQAITDALSEGKIVVAATSDANYYYFGKYNNRYTFFTFLGSSHSYELISIGNDNIWAGDTETIELETNKVFSLSSSSTNVQYPSAKCVYDALQEKTNKVSNATNGNFAGLDSSGNITDSGSKASDFATAAQGALADTAYQKPSTGIPASDLASGVIPQPEVFFAEYGVTTNSEIENAVINGKVIVCVYNYRLYVYGTYYTVGYNTKHCFYCWVNNKCYQISLAVSTDAWTDDGYIEIPDISGKADKTSVVALTGTSVTQELADNTIYQASELASLTISIPNGITSDYISQINFESGSTATTLTAPNTIIWFGDDLTNNVFVPAVNKQYVVIFYYDGTNVRSIVQSE